MGTLRDGHIGYREAIALLTIVLTMHIFLSLPLNYVMEGKNAGWMIPLVDLLITLIALLPFLAFLSAYPNQTLIEVAEESGGPATGLLVAIAIFIYSMFTNIIVMRQFTETVIVSLLPTTPISIITLLFFAGMIYSCYQGLESLSRGAWLLMPFITIGSLGVLVLVLNKANPNHLFPFWGSGFSEIAKYGVIKSFLPVQLILLSMLNPHLRDRTKLPVIAISSLVIAGVLISLTVMIYIMVFTVPSAISSGPYPLYNLTRLIYYGRFVQRVESIFIFIWIFGMLVKSSFFFYLAAVSLARGLKLPVYRPLFFPLAILTFSLNFLIPSFPVAIWLDDYVFRSYGWALALTLSALVWLLAKLKKKGGSNSGQPQETS
ncbi:MAG: GerAB/ArcD/ProY family transporter [Thermincolia bacterium]